MRITAFILSIWMVLLSVLPLSAANHCSSLKDHILTTANDDQDISSCCSSEENKKTNTLEGEKGQDCCNDCDCFCCHYPSSVVFMSLIKGISGAENYNSHSYDSGNRYEFHFAFNIYHPPK